VSIEDELSEREDTHSPSYRCVIERKGSYLPARRSPETGDSDKWDLAAVGLYKREAGTEPIKKLKHLIIQFDTQTSKCITSCINYCRNGMLMKAKIFRSSRPSLSRLKI